MSPKKILSPATLFVACLLLSAVDTHAQQLIESLPAWTHVASACSVDEANLSKYSFNFADFGFKSGAVSDVGAFGFALPITARCNVVNPLDSGNPSWNTLIVGYRDPDGPGIKYQVIVRLRRLSRFTGGVSTVATYNSNLVPLTARGEGFVQFSSTSFDFLKNEYFVEINVSRTDTNADPVVYMVRLEFAQTPPK